MSAPNEMAVVLDNVTKTYGDFVAVDKISFEVTRGEIFGFLGPNGSGKSTTIKMICGIVKPTEGSITVFGKDAVENRSDVVMDIGYMSQKFSLYPSLTVEENLKFYAGIYGLSNEERSRRIEELVESNGLTELRGRQTREIPTGWRQRLALACALIHKPRILFLDEPTGGVDPLSRQMFWDVIVKIAHGGSTVFVTTHYMDEAEYCDRIGLIYQGKLIALGRGSELKRKAVPGKVFEVTIHDAVSHIERIEKIADVKEVTIYGRELHVSFSEEAEDPGGAIKSLKADGLPIDGWREITPSLEDVFVTLMK